MPVQTKHGADVNDNGAVNELLNRGAREWVRSLSDADFTKLNYGTKKFSRRFTDVGIKWRAELWGAIFYSGCLECRCLFCF